MAIQISGTTVIDNSRNFTNINQVYAQNNVGLADSIFTSTGTGVQWKNISSLLSTNLSTYFHYLTLDTTSSSYGNLYQIYTNTSSGDTIDLSSTDVYSQFTSVSSSTLSINQNGYLILTI